MSLHFFDAGTTFIKTQQYRFSLSGIFMDAMPRASLPGLPTELRLAIFEYALAGTHVNLRHRGQRSSQDIRTPWSYLQINRRTRQEVLPLFYETTIFKLLDGMNAEKLEAWLDCVGHNAVAQIRKIEFNCKGRCTMFGLQPDTDYCHRSITLNLPTQRPSNFSELEKAALHCFDYQPGVELCSNGANGCWEGTYLSARRQVGFYMRLSDRTIDGALMAGLLLTIFRALELDNSTSAA